MKSARKKKGVRLGQHFLTGPWAARKLSEAVCVQPDEKILEIGPGKGALTKELLATGSNVVAIEKDEKLVEQLQRTFSEKIRAGKLKVVLEDIRDVTAETLGLKKYVVAANIPYYITGEIIRQFLEAKVQPRAMALLVQKEVAERIIARNGKESILSLSVKAYGTPKVVAKVSRGNFSPPPSVDSAILLVDNISKVFFLNVSEKVFFKVVRAGFASKRKFLANNLAAVFGKEEARAALALSGMGEKARAEDVPLEKWGKIAQELL
ncbi:MAG: 16S rRNA (adenine(1518)-N(6)/adenine(1519)-N(6))-dimethyltransferase RsmA [bacterium]|nr:16S rRNA (adenine(1518)-N(6)/adenine(1519)-N(6))-dimethyltransferase RsmA [bacterium]